MAGWLTGLKYPGAIMLFAATACNAADPPLEPLRTFPEPPRVVLREEAPEPSCPRGTVLVDGDSYPVALRTCLEGKPYRCRRFSEKVRLIGEPTRLRFCVDVYEHPNRKGATPEVGMTWHEAKASCEQEGKRLCTEDEWTLACEGPDRNPYPTGLVRDAEACNIDRPWMRPDNTKLNGPRRQEELDRLSQSVPSGSSGCVSHYGAVDMTGNVDEWVENRDGRRYRSGLKGGWWGPVRNRCRPITLFHNEWHHGYQISTRCCSEPSRPEHVPDDVHLRRSPSRAPGEAVGHPGRKEESGQRDRGQDGRGPVGPAISQKRGKKGETGVETYHGQEQDVREP